MKNTIEISQFLNEAWNDLLWNNMELVLYKDGDYTARQKGSRGTDEESIIYKLDLDTTYWADSCCIREDADGSLETDPEEKLFFFECLTPEVKEAIEKA